MEKNNEFQWLYANRIYVPNTAPHETVNETEVKSKGFFKGKKGVAARWTSCFDIGFETDWWYVIKDTPFDISDIKAKRRYEIKRGMKYFDVRRIDPEEYCEEMFDVYIRSLSGYPEQFRPSDSKEKFFKFIGTIAKKKDTHFIYGAFFRETQELCGYMFIPTYEKWAALSALKTDPKFEKYQINAAIIYGVLLDYNEKLSGDFYISDGQRTINHKTNFQNYLEKYFLFRKAYCKLNVEYRWFLKIVINILYPFKKLFLRFDEIKYFHLVNSFLRMDECARGCKKI